MTYSKGPWIYDAESGEIRTKDRTGFWGPDHEPVVVATVEPLDGVDNGPLMAAAKEMIDVLNVIEMALRLPGVTAAEVLDENSPIRDAIRTVIDKVEGKQ